MADRSVVIRLQAQIDDFKSQLAIAQKSVDGLKKSTDDAAKTASTGFGKLAQSARDNKDAYNTVGMAMLGIGAAAGAGVGLAIKSFADFDQAMSRVSASTHDSAGQLSQLRTAAMQAGAQTKFSSVEAADGINELAKAGVSTKDILNGGLKGALSLAAAGELSVSEAAQDAASAMTQFQLKGSAVPHIADLLAAAAGKAQGSVHDMGYALEQSGLVAHQTGLSIEETTGGLAAFASAGLIGSDAGTSFKTMLQSLTPQSQKAADAMDQYNLSAYDAQGKFIGLAAYAGKLQAGLKGMSDEQRNATLQTLFGSDAVRAASVLYQDGQSGIQGWINKVNDTGYASETAAKNMDNLKGDLSNLGSSFENLFIGIGGSANGPLRAVTQDLTAVVNVAGSLNGPMKTAALGLGSVTGAAGLLGGGALIAIPKVVELRDALKTMGPVGEGAAKAMSAVGTTLIGPWGLALAAGTVALGVFINHEVSVQRQVDSMSAALDQQTGAVTKNAKAVAAKSLEDSGALKSADQLGISLSTVTAAATGNAAALKEIHDKTQDVIDAGARMRGGQEQNTKVTMADVDAAKNLSDAVGAQADITDKAQAATRRQADALGTAKDATDKAGASASTASGALGALGAASDGAGNSVKVLAGLSVTAYSSLADYAKALGLSKDASKDLQTATENLGKSLSDFVDPIGTYTSMLQAKNDAETKSKDSTADATMGIDTSWDTMNKSTQVSLDAYLKTLDTQVKAQTDWKTNMLELASEVPAGTLSYLAQLGPKGAPLVAQLVNASHDQLAKFVADTASQSKQATDDWGTNLTLAQPVLAAVAQKAGKGTVDALAKELSAGTTTVSQIAQQYGVSLAAGLNPVLSAVGKSTITASYISKMSKVGMAHGGLLSFLADGGLGGALAGPAVGSAGESHVAQIAPAGAWRVWAEPETGGEAYIPLAPGKRDRSTEIWRQAGRRLGVTFAEYANGGFYSTADVPKVPSVSPYSGIIGDPGTSTMTAGYDDVIAKVQAALAAQATSAFTGTAAGGVQKWLPTVLQALSIVGQPASLAQTVLRRMNQESGGNATIVNTTDSNWKAGHPSVGLMQVIAGTWNAYKRAGYTGGPFEYGVSVNPLNNILASMDYAVARYGSLASAYNRAGGYDQGGVANGMGYLPKYTIEPERVLSPRQTKAFEEWMRTGSGQGGAGHTFNISATTPVEERQAAAVVARITDAVAANGLAGLVR